MTDPNYVKKRDEAANHIKCPHPEAWLTFREGADWGYQVGKSEVLESAEVKGLIEAAKCAHYPYMGCWKCDALTAFQKKYEVSK